MKYIKAVKREHSVGIWVCAVVVIELIHGGDETSAFHALIPVLPGVVHRPTSIGTSKNDCLSKKITSEISTTIRSYRTIRRFSSKPDETDPSMNGQIESRNDDDMLLLTPTTSVAAKTGTVNERLIAELQAATALEKSNVGSSSSSSSGRNGKSNNNKFTEAASFFKSSKTDAERRAAIAEAQNLNGVNPITTLFGALFALACALGLWYVTQSLASYFALHPSDSDIYFVERVTLLSRNIIMGLSALASGFFGVTGIGILLLAIRVGYGVVTGELDPTPIASSQSSKSAVDSTKVDMSNVWDMMMNKSSKKGPR